MLLSASDVLDARRKHIQMRQDHFLSRYVPKSLQKEAAEALAEIAGDSAKPKRGAKKAKRASKRLAKATKTKAKAKKADGRGIGPKLRWAAVRYQRGDASEADKALLAVHGKLEKLNGAAAPVAPVPAPESPTLLDV
jgi:hypothetical protein